MESKFDAGNDDVEITQELSYLWLYCFKDWCIHQGDLTLK